MEKRNEVKEQNNGQKKRRKRTIQWNKETTKKTIQWTKETT
jgi:hypothetical protein